MYKKFLVSILLTVILVGCGHQSSESDKQTGDQMDAVSPIQDQITNAMPADGMDQAQPPVNPPLPESTQAPLPPSPPVPPPATEPDAVTPPPAPPAIAANPDRLVPPPTDSQLQGVVSTDSGGVVSDTVDK